MLVPSNFLIPEHFNKVFLQDTVQGVWLKSHPGGALGRVEKRTPECTSLLVRFFQVLSGYGIRTFIFQKNRESKLSHSKDTFSTVPEAPSLLITTDLKCPI